MQDAARLAFRFSDLIKPGVTRRSWLQWSIALYSKIIINLNEVKADYLAY